mgnify:CR=1 FL=1
MILFEIIFIKNIQIIKPNKHTKNDRIKKLNFTYSIPIGILFKHYRFAFRDVLNSLFPWKSSTFSGQK